VAPVSVLSRTAPTAPADLIAGVVAGVGVYG
jgi:hypothetical protein